MSESGFKHHAGSPTKHRDAEIVAQRNKGLSLLEIGRLWNLSGEGVRQIIKRRPASDANKSSRDQAFARLKAVDGAALIEAGMPVQRLAALAGTTPRRVEQWLQLTGIAKYC